MNIRAQLEDGSTAMEPFGSITLADDEGGEIVDPNTYLDAWFTGLYELVEAPWPVSIDLVDEPDLLRIREDGAAFRLEYGDQSLLVSGREDLKFAVERECTRVLSELRLRRTGHEVWPQILAELEERMTRSAV